MKVEIAPIFKPMLRSLFGGGEHFHDFFLYGGRDGGKSATACIVAALYAIKLAKGKGGNICLARAFYERIRDSLLTEMRKVFALYPELAKEFDIGENYLRHKSGKVNFIFTGINVNPMSLKGLSNIKLLVVDEADACSERGLEYLRPTIREEEAICIWLFNPTVAVTPFAKLFHAKEFELYAAESKSADSLSKAIFCTYKTNPWLSKRSRLEIEAARKAFSPAKFDNVFEGRFKVAEEGGLLENVLRDAREGGRIGDYPFINGQPVFAVCDLGYKDFTVFWFFHALPDGTFRFFDCLAGNGLTIKEWLIEIYAKGYGHIKYYLPADARQVRGYTTTDSVCIVMGREGLQYEIVEPQANLIRLDNTREIFGRFTFHEEKCADALFVLANLRMKRIKEVEGDTIEHNTNELPTKDYYDPISMMPQIADSLTPQLYRAPQFDVPATYIHDRFDY